MVNTDLMGDFNRGTRTPEEDDVDGGGGAEDAAGTWKPSLIDADADAVED